MVAVEQTGQEIKPASRKRRPTGHRTSVLKRSVSVGLVLFALIPPNSARCWLQDFGKEVTDCQDIVDKTWHTMGSFWINSRCDKCTCKTDLMECCQRMPRVHASEGCIVEYDYDTCTFQVIQMSGRAIPCSYGASLK
ncbi:beta-microseminoprotein J1-like [Salminus brasiliensis]|uniref:beta-microseminoprotein J1-like n=1 Tax=Salminus brasiliensis TaxID=930266 RepID=UPI003B8317B2